MLIIFVFINVINMVKQCVYCNNTLVSTSNRSFHIFPKDETLRKKWFQAINMDFEKTVYIYLCSDHFSNSDLVNKYSGRRYLVKGAVPVVDPGSGLCQQETHSRFPANGILRKNWLHILGYPEDKCLSKRSDICSRHFNSKDIGFRPGGRKYLKRGAVPVVPSTQSSQEHSSNLSSVPVSSTNPVNLELMQNLYSLSSSIEVHIKSESDDDNAFTTTEYIEERAIEGSVTNRMSPKTEINIGSECEDGANVPTIEAVEETIEYLSDSSTLTAMSEKSFESDDPSEPAKITTDVSKTFLPVEEECPTKAKRDMDSSAQKSWRMAKRRISEQKRKIRKIQVQNRRLRSRVANLQSLLKHLFHNYEFEKKS